jgi:hypothetical protein
MAHRPVDQGNSEKACRYCGTLPHIPGSQYADFPIYNDVEPQAWHSSASCVASEEPVQ